MADEATPSTTTTPTATPAPADPMAAMDAGIAAADDAAPAPKPADATPPAEPDPEAIQPADVKPPDGYERDDKGRFVKKPEAAPVPGTPEAKAAADKIAADKAKAPDTAVEAEIAALKLGKDASERFRSMAAEIKALAPMKAELEKAGIKDLSQLPQMVERSKKADDLISMVMDTGASPDQYGMTLDYLKLVNRASAGDRGAAAKCLEYAQKEVEVFAKLLGKEIPGIHDPLAAHADLLKEVEDGDITRARALEIAQLRGASQQGQVINDRQRQQDEQTQAAQQGTGALAQWDQKMLASDPSYRHKREILSGLVATIKETAHPSRWLELTERAYARIPANAAAPAAAPVLQHSNAVRPGGPRPAVLIPETATAAEAMDLGIAAAG